MSDYLFRLFCVCFSIFFLLHFALGILVYGFTPFIVRFASRFAAHSSARILLLFRCLPPAVATFCVAALCVPSYLSLETGGAELISLQCLAATVLGVAVLCFSLVRTACALQVTRCFTRTCQMVALRTTLPGAQSPVWMVAVTAPWLMLVGFFRTELVISRELAASLTEEELTVALRHERAHGDAKDNLAQLGMLLLPGLLPGFRGYDALEREWSKRTEWAADDAAVDGDARRSLALASALLVIARASQQYYAQPLNYPQTLTTNLLGDSRDLAERVERLMRTGDPDAPTRWHAPQLRVMALGCAMALAASARLHGGALVSVHELLEQLVN